MQKKCIFLILALALLLRLYHINAPIIGMHSWRQADTAAIARNFSENGMRLLYPQIDWSENGPGFVESEFQFYPFIVALLYQVFGVHEWIGRLVSILFALLAIYFLYLFARQYLGEKAALWGALLFSILPLNIYYTRTFQPEGALLAAIMVGIFLFSRWLETGKFWQLIVSALSVSLACSIKLHTLYLGLPLLFLAWSRFGKKTFLQWRLIFYALLIFAPLVLWFYHAHQIFHQYHLTFTIWQYGTDKWGNWDLLLTWDFWNKILFQYMVTKHFSLFLLPVFVSAFFMKREKEERVFDFWLIASFICVLIAGRANALHEYYQVPYMLPICALAGKVFARYLKFPLIRKRAALLLIVSLIGIGAVGGRRYFFRYMAMENAKESSEIHLGKQVVQITEPASLVIAVNKSNPGMLYNAHRKGWNAGVLEATDETFLAPRTALGAKYLIGIHDYFKEDSDKTRLEKLFHSSRYRLVYNDEKAFILKLGL